MLAALHGDVSEMPIAEVIRRIEALSRGQAKFWASAHGWAPVAAAGLLSKSRLDWQVSLCATLRLWLRKPSMTLANGELILAWANLGALIEGEIKLLLSVFYENYKADVQALKASGVQALRASGVWHVKKDTTIEPDSLTLNVLHRFVVRNSLLGLPDLMLISVVQQRRNAIHAFKDRPIGDSKEFELAVRHYLLLKRNVGSRLPYPDDICEPCEF